MPIKAQKALRPGPNTQQSGMYSGDLLINDYYDAATVAESWYLILGAAAERRRILLPAGLRIVCDGAAPQDANPAGISLALPAIDSNYSGVTHPC